jgi:hypothetical protein
MEGKDMVQIVSHGRVSPGEVYFLTLSRCGEIVKCSARHLMRQQQPISHASLSPEHNNAISILASSLAGHAMMQKGSSTHVTQHR